MADRLGEIMASRIIQPISRSPPRRAGVAESVSILFLFLCGLPAVGRLRVFARLNQRAKAQRRKGELMAPQIAVSKSPCAGYFVRGD